MTAEGAEDAEVKNGFRLKGGTTAWRLVLG